MTRPTQGRVLAGDLRPPESEVRTVCGFCETTHGQPVGRTIHLVPVAAMHAQVDGGYFGTLHWCQSGLGNVIGWQKETQYCGA
jgi:hypothetical protein